MEGSPTPLPADVANTSKPLWGRPSKRILLGAVWPLLFASFFGSLLLATHWFPSHYDWRYRVISNLLSPRDNPRAYWIPSLGISVAGLLMIPLTAHLDPFLKSISQPGSRAIRIAFSLGIYALIASALVVPQHSRPILGSSRWHEIFADASALGMETAILGACWCAGIAHYSPPRNGRQSHALLFWAWTVLSVLPTGGVALSEGLLLYSHSHSQAAETLRNWLVNSVFWHLGFWEWTAATAVFLFLGIGVYLVPD